MKEEGEKQKDSQKGNYRKVIVKCMDGYRQETIFQKKTEIIKGERKKQKDIRKERKWMDTYREQYNVSPAQFNYFSSIQ